MKRGAEVAATSRGLDAVKQVIWARLSGSDRRLIRTSGSDNRISLHVLLLAVGSLLAEAILARTLQPADTETEAQEESHAQDSSANLEEAKSPGVTVLPEGQKRPLRDDAPLIDDDLTEALKSLRALVNRTLGEIGAQPLDDAKAPSPNFLSWKSDDWSALGAAGVAPLGAAAGGGGGGGGGPVINVAPTAAGTVVKGYLKGAVVWRDANNNGRFDWVDANNNKRVDPGEVVGDHVAITDEQGKFSQLGGVGTIRVFGGVDLYGTGLDFKGILSAPESATVITSITTLIEALRQPGEGVAIAASRVKSLLGIGTEASAADLLTLDPIDAALAGGTNSAAALKLYALSAAISNLFLGATAATKKAFASAAKPISDVEAANAVVAATASVLSSQSQVDFADKALITAVITQLDSKLQGQGVALGSVVEPMALSEAIANINGLFVSLVANASSARNALIALAQTEYLVQNDLTETLEASTGSGFDSGRFTASALQERLAEITDVVGSINAPANGQRAAPGRPFLSVDSSLSPEAPQEILDEKRLSAPKQSFNVKLGNASPQAGDVLRVYIDGQEVASKTLNEAEVTSALAAVEIESTRFAGVNESTVLRMTASVDSAAGVKGLVSRPLQVLVDTGVVAPKLVLSSLDSGIAGDGITNFPPTISVAAIEARAQLRLEVLRDGVSLGTSTSLSNGIDFATSLSNLLQSLAPSSTLIDGSYRIIAEQTDKVGHVSDQAILAITLDRVAPQLSTSQNAVTLNKLSQGKLSLGFSSPDADRLRANVLERPNDASLGIQIESGRVIADFAALPDGRYTLRLEAFDRAGNSSFVDVSITLDQSPPTIAFLDLSEGRVIAPYESDQPWRISATVEGLADGTPVVLSLVRASDGRSVLSREVTVLNQAVAAVFEVNTLLTLTSDRYQILAQLTDSAGNRANVPSDSFQLELKGLEGGLEPLSSSALSATKAAVYSQSFAANTLA
ncbi:MAG: hypothetical protein EB088_14220, partial [Betaproteobacteria bacterium]|nr:hypothetical protein [Betaproteobacteria bacterium]